MTTIGAEQRGRQASDLLPGGVGRGTLAVGRDVPRAVRGEGYEIVDAAGNRLIDLNNNFTTHVHGNAHPEIVAAASEALRDGLSFGVPHDDELEHARVLVPRIAGAEQVRYANSGTEADLTAIRMARALTGRERIVALAGAYHGTSETALCTGTKPLMHRGIPAALRGLVDAVPIGEVGALRAAVDRADGEIAAILLDLAPNRPGLRPLAPEFVRTARELADASGALLIFDEVITFRLAHGGFQETVGVRPDLTVLGKLIGGGLPVGAVTGPAAHMAVLDPFSEQPIESAGTFTGNPATMRAGRRSLELLDRSAIERIDKLGERLRDGLGDRLGNSGWRTQGTGSLAKLMPERAAPEQAVALAHALWWAAYRRSVLITPNGTLSVSTPMTDEVVDRAVEALAAATHEVGRG